MTARQAEWEYWSRLARSFDDATRFIVGAETQRVLKDWLQAQIDPAHSVLELGCGTGQFSEVIARGARQFIASDGSAEMLALARSKLEPFKNVTVREEDCYCVSLPAGLFDTVFLGNVLHIVGDPALVLAEVHRLLKDGGKVIAIDSTASGLPWWSKLEMGVRYLLAFGPPPLTNRNMKPAQVARIVHGAGFKVIDLALVGHESRAICLTARKARSETARRAVTVCGIESQNQRALERPSERTES